MSKEVVINTSAVNSYGSRVLTSGLDTTQYERNPIILWMHRRWGDNSAPIGRIEKLRRDGDRLIGTPVFDENDEFAKKIADKWEHGFLNMCSAAVEILETSVDPADLIPGQTRATVTRGRLREVSIVDIGANDDAIKLMNADKMLELAAGEMSDILPLIDNNKPLKNNLKMKKETLILLGLSAEATDEQVHDAVKALTDKAASADKIELANITASVTRAIEERRITGDKKEHFIELGKKVGSVELSDLLGNMQPARKPNEMVNLSSDNPQPEESKKYAKLSEVPEKELLEMRKDDPKQYAELYKAEYGVEL